MKHPSRNNITYLRPHTMIIVDAYDESVTLNKRPQTGDVMQMQLRTNEHGEYSAISIGGRFHRNTDKQSLMNSMARIRGMIEISEREDQILTLYIPHPRMGFRGYGANFEATWDSGFPIPFDWSFEFEVARRPRQPVHTASVSSLNREEGKAYGMSLVDSDHSSLESFAHYYIGKSFVDYRKIGKIITENELLPSESRDLTGVSLKVPWS